MIKVSKPINQINELWRFLPVSRRRQFKVYVLVIFVSAFLEVASIGALIPFLIVISGGGNDYIKKIPYLDSILVDSAYNFFYIAASTFLVLSAFSYAIRFLLLKLQISFSQGVGHDISVNIFTKVLYQPYLRHKMNPSSEVISILVTKVNSVVYNTVLPFATICSSLLILSSIVIFGVIFKPIITITIILVFLIFYFLALRVLNKRVRIGGKNIALMQNSLLANIQISLGGIRDIILNNKQFHYVDEFSKIDSSCRNSITKIQLSGALPKFILEVSAIFFLIGLAIFLNIDDPKNTIIILPLLGVIAYMGQRLLPLFQQLYASYTNILGDEKTMEDILEALRITSVENDELKSKTILFREKIEIRGMSFAYPSGGIILDECDLIINKGDRVGIVGDSGSGKSTLLDILMGLLLPSKGFLYVDNQAINFHNIRSWQSIIGHVPQNIYLSQGTVADNVAFGVTKNKADSGKIIRCLKLAGMGDFILNLPNGIETEVGERGSLLSGGQIQRIGIARALYKEPKILVLDEISSALDKNIEASILEVLFALPDSITILMVAHKESALSYCDYLIKLEKKKLIKKQI